MTSCLAAHTMSASTLAIAISLFNSTLHSFAARADMCSSRQRCELRRLICHNPAPSRPATSAHLSCCAGPVTTVLHATLPSMTMHTGLRRMTCCPGSPWSCCRFTCAQRCERLKRLLRFAVLRSGCANRSTPWLVCRVENNALICMVAAAPLTSSIRN